MATRVRVTVISVDDNEEHVCDEIVDILTREGYSPKIELVETGNLTELMES